MKKRLRKKKLLGEFTQYGFRLNLTFEPPLEDLNVWMDKLFVFSESFDLGIGGSFGVEGAHTFVTALYRNTVVDSDRAMLAIWLRFNMRGTVDVGPLEDTMRTKWPDDDVRIQKEMNSASIIRCAAVV